MKLPKIVRYGGLVLRKFWYLWAGDSVFVVGLALYERICHASVSWQLYVWPTIGCLLSALFWQGFEEWKRGLPCLVVSDPEPQPWEDDQGICTAYRLMVKNGSDTTTIDDVGAKLTAIDPRPQDFRWLPISLVVMHDRSNPPKVTFSLNPGEIMGIDVVSAVRKGTIDIRHSVADVKRSLAGTGKYVFTVELTGRRVTPVTKRIEVWEDEIGMLNCKSL